MIFLRLLRVLLHLIEGLLICAFLFPVLGQAARTQRIQAWSIRLVAIFGVQINYIHQGQQQPAARALVVANHVSWLDIFIINTLHPSRFVAKSDIRDWPLIGWLCDKSGTIFISRGSIRDVRRIFQNLVDSLKEGQQIAFFPEGTTAAQGAMLPFHANLFEAAIDAHVAIQPFALRYIDEQGGYHRAADFIGDMTFFDSMLCILRAGPMTAELILLPSMASDGAHRRSLALAAHAAISEALLT
jgi:1-acyl-sn-glycerol-3-phosphate acyltransferase